MNGGKEGEPSCGLDHNGLTKGNLFQPAQAFHSEYMSRCEGSQTLICF